LRIIVGLCLFFLMPPLASMLDRMFGHRQAVRRDLLAADLDA
jgi:hypothetical protein